MIQAFLARLILNPYVLAAGAGALLVAAFAAWWTYTSLAEDRDRAVQELAASKVQVERLAEVANSNAAALARAEERNRATVAELELAQAEIASGTQAAREEDRKIQAAPKESAGPVPPVLGDFLIRRFGGGR